MAEKAFDFEITQANLLVVEGKEDGLFFKTLITYLGLTIQVMPIGGKEKLRPNLRALVSSPRFVTEVRSLGVVRDADADPKAAFQSVRDALIAANLPSPDRPLLFFGDTPRVAVMIMPQENESGMLEDLCLKAVSNDPALFCVEQYFQCLEQQGIKSMSSNIAKARIQAFLAAKPQPGKRLGEAAEAGYWPWEHPAFEPVKNFLRHLAS